MARHTESRSPGGWLQALLARPRAVHFLLLIIGLAFGIAVVTQVKASQTNPLEALDEEELVELLAELDSRDNALSAQQRDLEAQLRELHNEVDQAKAAKAAAQQRLETAEIAAGLVAVHGPGIEIVASDQADAIPSHVFVTTLAELRNAGAEAIELNGVRLRVNSWFLRSDSGLEVDGVTIAPPYQWLAIGDPDTLSAAVGIRGGAVAQMRLAGAEVSVEHDQDLVIDSIASPITPRWAKPEE